MLANDQYRIFKPETAVRLSSGQVHVWRLDLGRQIPLAKDWMSALSIDEMHRAERFRFDRDRDRFIVRRGMLRHILSSFVGVPAGEIAFTHNRYGKPSFGRRINGESFSFNLSSSGEMAMVAIGASHRIGIDVEFVDTTFPHLDVAEKYFTSDEVAALRELRSEERAVGFCSLWTQKEAYVKAIGKGLGYPLPNRTIFWNQSGTSFTPAGNSPMSDDRWFLATCRPADDYVASIAASGYISAVFHWQL